MPTKKSKSKPKKQKEQKLEPPKPKDMDPKQSMDPAPDKRDADEPKLQCPRCGSTSVTIPDGAPLPEDPDVTDPKQRAMVIHCNQCGYPDHEEHPDRQRK
jgi:hypothetical protein